MQDSPDFYCDEILSGETPVTIVAQTERVLAFHHTLRSWDTHIVVMPKQHVRRLSDVEDTTLLAELLQVVIRIVRDHGFAETDYKVVVNGGSYQSEQHLHVHLVSGAPLNPDNPAQKGELAAGVQAAKVVAERDNFAP